MIEGQVLSREGDRWTVSGEVRRSVIPSLLRGVIAARIDHLPTAAKVVLQHASVVGRVFTYRALQMLTNSDEDLDRSLAHLLRVDFIREQARLPEVEYLFKHVLTQEAAYASILNEQRQSLHHKVVIYLEQTGVDTSDEQAAVLAHHCLRAEDWEKALEYTLQAAERASKLYARSEAIAHYWQALELMERISRTVERRRTHMGVVLSLGKLPGSFRDANEVKEGFRHIDEAIRSADDSGEVGILAQLEAVKGYSLWDESILIQAVTHSEASGDVFARAFTVEMYAHYLGANGQYVKALTHFGQLIDMMSTEGENYEQAMNMASGGRCYCARAGKLEEALRYAAEAREIGEAMGDARLLAWCAVECRTLHVQGPLGTGNSSC